MTPTHEQLKDLSEQMQKILAEEIDSSENKTNKFLLTDLSDKLSQLMEEVEYYYSLN